MTDGADWDQKGFRETERAFAEAAKRATDLRPPLKKTVATLNAMKAKSFRTGTTPEGFPWAALTESTVLSKIDQGFTQFADSPLRRSGGRGLEGQSVVRMVKDGIQFVIPALVSYGVFHLFGTRRMPTRPFFPLVGSVQNPAILQTPKVRKVMNAMRTRIAKYVAGDPVGID